MAPVVEHNLKSEYNTEYVDLNVSAKEVSGGGGALSADNMHIYVNGEEVKYRGCSELLMNISCIFSRRK